MAFLSLDIEEVFKNAPERAGNFFNIPPVKGEPIPDKFEVNLTPIVKTIEKIKEFSDD